MNQRRSRVAWPAATRVGGDLDQAIRQKIRLLLDDFGVALENESSRTRINLFVFPIFREFNLLAAVISDSIVCAVSTSIGGVAAQRWLDWRTNPNPPGFQDLAVAVQQELGWTPPIFTLSFPLRLLDLDSLSREDELTGIAGQWVQAVVTEAERQARIVRLNPIFRGRDFPVENDLCFVLMPFREPFLRLYQEQVKPTLESMGLRVTKSNDIFTPSVIVEDIWEHINRARFLVADVTGKNPNVFYELGIAHTVGKEVIILTQSEEDIPFDLRHLRHFTYVDNQEGWRALRQNLERAARAILGR